MMMLVSTVNKEVLLRLVHCVGEVEEQEKLESEFEPLNNLERQPSFLENEVIYKSPTS